MRLQALQRSAIEVHPGEIPHRLFLLQLLRPDIGQKPGEHAVRDRITLRELLGRRKPSPDRSPKAQDGACLGGREPQQDEIGRICRRGVEIKQRIRAKGRALKRRIRRKDFYPGDLPVAILHCDGTHQNQQEDHQNDHPPLLGSGCPEETSDAPPHIPSFCRSFPPSPFRRTGQRITCPTDGRRTSRSRRTPD